MNYRLSPIQLAFLCVSDSPQSRLDSFFRDREEMSIFKKKGGQISATSIPMTEAEAALAQSDFNIEKITEIQNKFAGGAVLLVPGRIFIREGLLWKVCRKGIKKRQFFLFNDILVYGSVVASRYSNQHTLALDKMSVSSDCFYQPRVQSDFDADTESLDQQLDPSNAFQISHADKSFHVFASSSADKANWLANLNKHISRAAQMVADSPQQMMTRPVWVPDAVAKECMVCHTKFSTFVRKHHCRRCGRVVCSACSPHHVSLSTIDSSRASQTPHSDQSKLERVCKECFKEMTAQHNRSNSQSRGVKDSKGPQNPSQDALSLSTSIQSPVSKSSDHDSTDTEDSDDSSDEKSAMEEPAKSSSQKESSSLDPVANAVQASTELVDHVKLDKSSPIAIVQEPRTDNPTDSVQPTPPPRKKKLEKLLKKQIAANESVSKAVAKSAFDENVGEDCDDGGGETGGKELTNTKKTKRKNKHSKPVDTQEIQGTAQDTTQDSTTETTQDTTLETTQDTSPETTQDITGVTAEPEQETNKEDLTTNERELSKTIEKIEETLTEAVAEGEIPVVMAAEGDIEEVNDKIAECETEQSPSSQKRGRGRRKKFKATTERTDNY